MTCEAVEIPNECRLEMNAAPAPAPAPAPARLLLPFEDQVEPLGHRRSPNHCYPGGPAAVVGDGEEQQEGGVRVSELGGEQPHPPLAHRGPLEALGHPHSLRVHRLHPADEEGSGPLWVDVDHLDFQEMQQYLARPLGGARRMQIR